MSEQSKKARADMRAKATRLAEGEPRGKIDASDWTPPESLNANAQTGARPIRPRIYKNGGTVHGDRGPRRADRKPRADGGKLTDEQRKLAVRLGGDSKTLGIPGYGVPKIVTKEEVDRPRPGRAGGGSIVKDLVNRSVPEANAELGKPHVGAFKKGGKAERCNGGAMKNGGSANYTGGTRPTGGRTARKSGGRTKGKTNINIVIGQPAAGAPNMPMPQMPARPPVLPPQMAAPPMPPPGMPAGGPPMGGPGMPPPMMRKSGGRAIRSPADLDAGGGGAMGRLEKIKLQRAAAR